MAHQNFSVKPAQNEHLIDDIHEPHFFFAQIRLSPCRDRSKTTTNGFSINFFSLGYWRLIFKDDANRWIFVFIRLAHAHDTSLSDRLLVADMFMKNF